jgi:predicted LPLAT superfamily acyltransferase
VSLPADRVVGSATGWTGQHERGNLALLRAIRWIAVHAGRGTTRLLLHPITLYYLLTHGQARRESARYLSRVAGHPAGWRAVCRHIHTFATTVLDRVYFLQERHDAFEVRATGEAAVHAHLHAGAGAMLVGAHFGSFEALRAVAQHEQLPVAMLMYEDNARLINAALAALAPHVQLQTIALGRPGAMLALRRFLDGGGLAGMLADRTLPSQSQRSGIHRLPFLGLPARFSDGPFRLAALLRRPVFLMAGIHHGGNRYEVRFVEVADFRSPAAAGAGAADRRVAEALQRYVALLEALCREAPYNWFNFYDFWAADDADENRPAAPAAAAPAP